MRTIASIIALVCLMAVTVNAATADVYGITRGITTAQTIGVKLAAATTGATTYTVTTSQITIGSGSSSSQINLNSPLGVINSGPINVASGATGFSFQWTAPDLGSLNKATIVTFLLTPADTTKASLDAVAVPIVNPGSVRAAASQLPVPTAQWYDDASIIPTLSNGAQVAVDSAQAYLYFTYDTNIGRLNLATGAFEALGSAGVALNGIALIQSSGAIGVFAISNTAVYATFSTNGAALSFGAVAQYDDASIASSVTKFTAITVGPNNVLIIGGVDSSAYGSIFVIDGATVAPTAGSLPAALEVLDTTTAISSSDVNVNTGIFAGVTSLLYQGGALYINGQLTIPPSTQPTKTGIGFFTLSTTLTVAGATASTWGGANKLSLAASFTSTYLLTWPAAGSSGSLGNIVFDGSFTSPLYIALSTTTASNTYTFALFNPTTGFYTLSSSTSATYGISNNNFVFQSIVSAGNGLVYAVGKSGVTGGLRFARLVAVQPRTFTVNTLVPDGSGTILSNWPLRSNAKSQVSFTATPYFTALPAPTSYTADVKCTSGASTGSVSGWSITGTSAVTSYPTFAPVSITPVSSDNSTTWAVNCIVAVPSTASMDPLRSFRIGSAPPVTVSVSSANPSPLASMYVGQTQTLLFGVNSPLVPGGASLSMSCNGFSVAAVDSSNNPASSCLSQTNIYFMLTATTATTVGVDVVCTLSASGDLAALVAPLPTFTITGGVVAIKGAFTVTVSSASATSVSSPISVNTGATPSVVITPAAAPTDSSFAISTLCTNLIGTTAVGQGSTQSITVSGTPAASAATIGLVFDNTMTGNVRCSFTHNRNDYPAIPDAYFVVKAAPVTPTPAVVPLVVTGVTTSADGSFQYPSSGLPNAGTSSATFNIGINGPSTALTSGTAAITLTCPLATIGYTSTVTGVTVTGSGTGSVTINWATTAAASANVPLVLTVAAPATGAGANVKCSWSAYSGPATAAAPSISKIWFFVGTVQPFTATAAASTIWESSGLSVGDAAYSTVVTVTPPATTTIDTDVSIGYGCKSSSGSVIVALNTLSFTSTAAKTFTVTSSSTDATAISCTFSVGGTDASHYSAPGAIPITVNPTLAFGVTGVPSSTATNTATSYTVVISRPTGSTIVTGDSFSSDITCTTSSSAASVAGVTVTGATGGTGTAFTLDGTTSSKSLTIALTTLVATAGAQVSCTWASVTSSSNSLYKVSAPGNFAFWVGTKVQLTATPSATSVIKDQQITVQVSAAASVIDSATNLNYNCAVCGVSNTGSVTTSGSSVSFSGTFPSATSANTFTLTGANPGQVTCHFTLVSASNGDAVHFIAPTDLVITVLPKKTLTVNVDNGIGAVTTLGLSYATPITPAASSTTTTVTATVNAPNPGYGLSVQVNCPAAASVTAAGADSVSGNTATFVVATTKAATFAILVTNPVAPAGVVISCSFAVTDTANPTAPAYLLPGAFDFYIGPVAALSASIVDPSATSLVYPGSFSTATTCTTATNAGGCNFAQVTVSATGASSAAIPSLGVSVTVTCTLGGSGVGVFVTSTAGISGSDTNSLVLAFAATTSTTATYFVRSATQSGSVSCAYSGLSGTDYRHYTLPTATAITITPPITVGATSAALISSTAGSYLTVSGSTVTTAATNTLTVTTSSVLTAGLTLTVGVTCNTVAPVGANVALTVTPATFDFTLAANVATTNFVITQPIVDTAYTHEGEYVQCQISYTTKVSSTPQVAPVISSGAAPTSFSYFVGKSVTWTVAPKSSTATIYANAGGSNDPYTYYFTPSACFGEGFVTFTASCALNGMTTGSLTLVKGNANFITGSFVPGTSDGTYVCTFSTYSTIAGVAPSLPAPLSITVVPRRRIQLTLTPTTAASSTSAATAPTITGSVTLSAAPTNGLTVVVSCSSASGPYTIMGMSKFYFFATTPTAQTFTFSGQLGWYGTISCTATSEFILFGSTQSDTKSDLDNAAFISATATVLIGTQYQITIGALPATPTPCNSFPISVTVPWVSSSTSTLVLYGNCNSGTLVDTASLTNNYLTFAAGGLLTQSFTFTPDARGANVKCTWSVGGANSGTLPYTASQYSTPAATTFTVGTPAQSLTVTPPTNTALVSGATSAVYTVAPSSAPAGNGLVVTISVSGGATATPASLTFTTTTAQTFTVTAPAADAGKGSTLTITYTLSDASGSSGASAPYYAVPASSTLTVSNNVNFLISADRTSYYTGSSATVSVKPDSAVGLNTDITVTCGTVFNTVVSFMTGDTVTRTFTVPIPNTAGSLTCTAKAGNSGAAYATVSPSTWTLTYTVNPAGSGGSSGAAGSSTGTTILIPCFNIPCAAFANVALPNLVIYAAMLLAAVFAARQ